MFYKAYDVYELAKYIWNRQHERPECHYDLLEAINDTRDPDEHAKFIMLIEDEIQRYETK